MIIFGPQCAYSDWIKHSKQLNFSLIRRGDIVSVRVIFRGAPSTFVFLFNPMFIFVNVYIVCMSESFESCRLRSFGR